MAAATVPPVPPSDVRTVSFGARIVVRDTSRTDRTFVLVGDDEIDAARGGVGIRSPLDEALMGRRAGDTVTRPRPVGDERVGIATIDYAELEG